MLKTHALLVASVMGASLSISLAAEKPLKALLITGGCCHNYATQKEILKKGLEERLNIVVDQIHADGDTKSPALPIYGNPDYAKGYDIVIHDECAVDINKFETIQGVMKPHQDGIPGVVLHCAMHSYRQPGFDAKIEKTGEPRTLWFEFIGIQSTGHGPQKPIAISYTEKNHPITKGLPDWTTVNEELYNNITVLPTVTPLANGNQEGQKESVVIWTNLYNKKTRVFGTTIGHNNATVEDARYLDLVSRGVLWAVDKLDANGHPKAGYGAVKK